VHDSDVLEIASLDPRQGVQYYVLVKAAEPAFAEVTAVCAVIRGRRRWVFLDCSSASIHPASQARQEHGSAFMTDHRTPLDGDGRMVRHRNHGFANSLGNNTNLVDPVRSGGPSTQPTQNLTSLAEMFDTSRYLAPTSDIVALLTLEHQIRMTNLMIRIGWDARIGAADDKLNPEIEEMLKYMLFADEEPLRNPVKGVSTFTENFPSAAPAIRRAALCATSI